MLITPHALLGAAILKRVKLLFLGIPLAIASHYMLDAIPGWDVGLTSAGNITIVIVDGVIAILLLGIVSMREMRRGKILIWLGGFLSILPDVMSQGCNIMGIQIWIPLENIHQYIQKDAQLYWSLPAQVLLSAIIVVSLCYKENGSYINKIWESP